MTSRPPPIRCPVRRSYSNNCTSSTRLMPFDGLQQLSDRRRIEVGVEQPPGTVGTAGQRMDISGEFVDGPLPNQRQWATGRRMDQRRNRNPLVVGRSHFDRGPDDAMGVEVLGDLAHQRRGQREVVQHLRPRIGPDGGHHQQSHRTAAGRRRQAASPSNLDRGLQGQPLEIPCRHCPLAGAEGQRPTDLRLINGFRVDAARRAAHVHAAGDIGDGTAQRRQRSGPDIPGGPHRRTGTRSPRSPTVARDPAVLPYRPVRIPDPRAEPDDPGRRVPHEMIVRSRRTAKSPPPRTIPPSFRHR